MNNKLRAIVVLCTLLLSLCISIGYGQENGSKVQGKLLVLASDTLKLLFNEIATDTTDLSTDAELEFTWLKSVGITSVSKMADTVTSGLQNYFRLGFSESISIDTMRGRLLTNAEIDTLIDIVWLNDTTMFGCYNYVRESLWSTDPSFGTNNAYWIWNPDQYYDESMGVLAAWEFTLGSENTRTIMDAGAWYVNSQLLSEWFWQEVQSQILDGIISIDGYGNYQTFVIPSGHQGYSSDMVSHGLWCSRLVAGQFNNYADGTMGMAPYSALIPVYGYISSDNLLKIVDFGWRYGARSIAIAHYLSNVPENQYALQYALDHDILPCIAVGPWYPIPQATLPSTLNVAGNVGSYKGQLSSYGDYPTPNLCSSGSQTSQAVSTAAGTAALVASLYPSITTDQLREKLLDACDPMKDDLWDPDEQDTQLGHGKLNAYRAIAVEKSGTISSDETWNGPIFISGDVTIPDGVTLTINLTTLANGVRRTHVRFGGESYTKPVQIIQPKLKVYGNLVVEGEEDEKILFSSLQRCIPYESGYISQWGGIEVMRGGSVSMQYALIENCATGIYIGTDDADLDNVEFCNVGRSIIIQNYDPQYGEPSISNCNIHNSSGDVHYNDNTGIGIAVWRGSPEISGCDIANVDVGVHYVTSVAKGTLDQNYIHSTWSHGVLCIDECSPRITRNRIVENEGYGISMLYTRKGIYLHNNIISNNGRKGLGYNPAIRTADGLFLYNSTARLHGNTIDSNRVGLHIESFSTLIGGDGTVGAYGTSGSNSFTDNDTTVYGSDHCKSLLGVYSGAHHYGHGNTMNGLATGMQAVARDYTDLWLQCNEWDPGTGQYFVTINGFGQSRIFRFPNGTDCWPIGLPYPDDQFEQAHECIASKDFDGALQIYVPLATSTIDSIILRAVNGFLEIYAADSLNANTVAIDSLLEYVAFFNRNGADSLKANIAYAQAILATMINDYDKADSLYEYADNYLTNANQLRNILASNMYLELYKQSDTTAAALILQLIESQFAGDPLISNAQDMFRYYVDFEANRYIRKKVMNGRSQDDINPAVIHDLVVEQNYPNPFGERTVVVYSISTDQYVRITLRNIVGQTIRVIEDSYQTAGKHFTEVDASMIKTGTYFIEVHTSSATKQITVCKLK